MCRWFKSIRLSHLGIAQPGSARALGAWGREFDSLYRDQLLGYGEMVITLDFDSGISGSSPDSPARYYCEVAQW